MSAVLPGHHPGVSPVLTTRGGAGPTSSMPASGARRDWFYPGVVSKVTGSWLSGGIGETGDEPQEYPGERLGLPQEGPGSAAPRGVRLLALLVDLVLMSLVTSLFVEFDVNRPDVMQRFNYTSVLVWFVITTVMVALFGFTAGKALLGLRVVRLDGRPMVGPLRAVPRTLLTALLLPAAIGDADGRGLHDKVTGTVVVRTR
jgi:uncharacterized RDD family membrane protein YckC